MSGFAWDWGFARQVLPLLLHGLQVTVLATLLGSLLAFALGLLWILLRLGRIRYVSSAIGLGVEFIRGTPLLIQLYVLFYILPNWGLTLSSLTTGVVGLGIFYSATSSEIYRAGIEGLPAGQWEAALTLGLPLRRVWLGVVLPQAVRAILPMMGNQVIGMFKETSLLSTITVMEMLGEARNIGSIEFRYIEPLTMAGALYFVISFASARVVRRLETARDAHV